MVPMVGVLPTGDTEMVPAIRRRTCHLANWAPHSAEQIGPEDDSSTGWGNSSRFPGEKSACGCYCTVKQGGPRLGTGDFLPCLFVLTCSVREANENVAQLQRKVGTRRLRTFRNRCLAVSMSRAFPHSEWRDCPRNNWKDGVHAHGPSGLSLGGVRDPSRAPAMYPRQEVAAAQMQAP